MQLKSLFKKTAKESAALYSRDEFRRSIPDGTSILEIGPFFSPFCRGKHVKYFDILDRDGLTSRAERLKLDFKAEDIPVIDFVSPVGDLSIVTETFDALFSSHVIEHQLDLIDHLQKASRLLNKAGSYYLIIPDKRYCFDHFHNESTIADVLNANFEKRQKHSLKSVIEHRALITHNEPCRHWQGDHGTLGDIASKIKDAIVEYEEKDYIDVHSLYFTPASFSQIIRVLNELGYIDFTINRLHETSHNEFEFFCVLEKKTAGEF